MIRFLLLTLVLVTFARCNRFKDSPDSAMEKISLRCRVLRLDPGFCERLGLDIESGPAILNDVETFFLFDLSDGTDFKSAEFNSGETVRLTDTFEDPAADEWIQVSARALDGRLVVEISPNELSAIRIRHEFAVELPPLGSVLFAAANPISDNRLVHIWIIDAMEIDRPN